MRAHAQVRHGSQQPMKLQNFHKYDTIDIACSKKVTLSQSSNKKAITNDTKHKQYEINTRFRSMGITHTFSSVIVEAIALVRGHNFTIDLTFSLRNLA